MAHRNVLRRRSRRRNVAIAAGLSALAALALAASADATLIVPTVATDDLTNNGNCTLREAVQASNFNAAQDQCPAGESGAVDIIALNANLYQLSLPAVVSTPDDNQEGDLDIQPTASSPLVILELSAPNNEAEIDGTGGGNADRVIDAPFGGTGFVSLLRIRLNDGNPTTPGGGGLRSFASSVFLNKSRVTNSSTDSLGGGIGVLVGDLSLVQSSITGNVSTAAGTSPGGGIYSEGGDVTIDRTTISNNQVNPTGDAAIDDTFGAGIAVPAGSPSAGSLTITDSTISGNSMNATDNLDSIGGVGLFSKNVPVTIRRSTFSGNTVSGTPGAAVGGGIFYLNDSGGDTTLKIENSTFGANLGNVSSFDLGGALNLRGGIATVANSTFLTNTADAGKAINYDDLARAGSSVTVHGSLFDDTGDVCGGADPVSSTGFNVERGTDCVFTGPVDQQNTDANPDTLGNNGGPTQTAVLFPGSPAVDAIPAANCTGLSGTLTDDQRGASRPGNEDPVAKCDIGAYEINRCRSVIANVVGTPAGDDITGTSNNESILGLGGNDNIDGGPGQDVICAGDGNDVLRDTEDGAADTWDGGPGTDLVIFPLTGSNGVTINLNTGLAESSVTGDADLLFSIENAQGGPGDDTLIGDAGPNTLTGRTGGDTLVGNGGIDLLIGDQTGVSGGPDSIFARDGIADVVDCGPDTDTAQTDRLSLDSVTACEAVDAPDEPPENSAACLAATRKLNKAIRALKRAKLKLRRAQRAHRPRTAIRRLRRQVKKKKRAVAAKRRAKRRACA